MSAGTLVTLRIDAGGRACDNAPMLSAAIALSAVVAGAPAAGPLRVLVLDLEPVGVDPTVAHAVDPLVLNAAGVGGVEVLAQSELKRLADVEATRAQSGCDSASCLAELAGAMGAQLVLFGSVSKLGATTTVSLSLFDGRTSAITRDALAVSDVGALPTQLPGHVRGLVERGRGALPRGAAADDTRGTADAHDAGKARGGDARGDARAAARAAAEEPGALFYAGLASAIFGGTALLAGGALAAFNEATIQDPRAAGATKRSAQQTGLVGLVVAGGGLAVTAAGGTLLALE